MVFSVWKGKWRNILQMAMGDKKITPFFNILLYYFFKIILSYQITGEEEQVPFLCTIFKSKKDCLPTLFDEKLWKSKNLRCSALFYAESSELTIIFSLYVNQMIQHWELEIICSIGLWNLYVNKVCYFVILPSVKVICDYTTLLSSCCS